MAAGSSRGAYARLLRLRHLELPTWQQVVYVEGAVALGVVLTLGELASAWIILLLPALVAVVVKFHDVLAGLLAAPPAGPDRPPPGDRSAGGPGPRGQGDGQEL